MDLIADLEARDLLQHSTDREALRARLEAGPVTLYYGCDPTADSLHTGNLIGLVVLRRFQDAGHRPIALAGGATGMVGDPSGRSEERNLLDEEALRHNVARINEQIARIVDAELVDNRDWTADLRLLDFLRDVGKHVTVNQMVARESVKARMASEHGISYTEFSYMLLQANDYLWLHDHQGCDLQIGGSDQWGNILGGIDLIRRVRGRPAHGLAWPIITDPGGTKLGKTTGARVWLADDRTSPYEFFQHWIQTEDRQVREFLAKFTLLPLDEVDTVVAEHEATPARRVAQRQLAVEATALVHGADAAQRAAAVSDVLFGAPLEGVDATTLDDVSGEVPATELTRERLVTGIDLVDVLVETGLASSKSDARRLVDQRGASVNNLPAGPGQQVGESDLLHGRYLLLRRGKDRYHLVVAVT